MTEPRGWSSPDLTVHATSVRGTGLRYSHTPHQDSVRIAVHEASGAVVFAVADGASGAADSRSGAGEACQAAMEELLDLLSRGGQLLDLECVVHAAAERLRQLALDATTLVAGIVQPEPGGPRVQMCRIGDAGAWLLDRTTGTYHALFEESEPVVPLPYVPDSVEQVVDHLTASEVLLVGTDGFENDRTLVAVWPESGDSTL